MINRSETVVWLLKYSFRVGIFRVPLLSKPRIGQANDARSSLSSRTGGSIFPCTIRNSPAFSSWRTYPHASPGFRPSDLLDVVGKVSATNSVSLMIVYRSGSSTLHPVAGFCLYPQEFW